LYQIEVGRLAVVHVVIEKAIQETFHNRRASSGASSSALIGFKE